MPLISTIRHDEIFNADENNQRVTIIGAGATGSRVFASLVELGLTKITVIDPDIVEAHNLANQIYSHKDIALPKVEACKRWMQQKTGRSVLPGTMEFIQASLPNEEMRIQGTVFLLTDTMSSRREIFEAHLRNNLDVYRVIETRMASTHGNVLVFNPNLPRDISYWVNTLIDDSEGEVSACGGSLSVGPTANIIANLAVWQYMHSKTSLLALERQISIYLKPLCISMEGYPNVQAA